ncbi:MAG: phosphoribosylanthranilate isomerase [Acetobacteraceae bacterium]|nr:phosphoribosylanthranilate isomerase [Acetobacteraceae bacterium]
MRVKVKICGVNSAPVIEAAAAAGADWIGFVFFPPSPRAVSPALAAELAARADPGPGRVGLFVAPSEDEVAAVLRQVRLDALQIYGPAPTLAQLRARFGLPVWRAVAVGCAGDPPADAGGADRLVLDAKPPADASRPGGNAEPFDWSVLRGWKAPVPWILAGGLTAANVAQAIGVTGAQAVDVSSGVETAPGLKDPKLIRAFIGAARSAPTPA